MFSGAPDDDAGDAYGDERRRAEADDRRGQ